MYWFYLDNQHVSTYVPIYAGVQEIHPLYKTWNPDEFDENSARWNIDFIDNLLYLRWQEAIKDLHAVRDPMEKGFFEEQADIDKEALALFKKNPKKASQFLTEYSQSKMEVVVQMYRDLRKTLITKYTNNKSGL